MTTSIPTIDPGTGEIPVVPGPKATSPRKSMKANPRVVALAIVGVATAGLVISSFAGWIGMSASGFPGVVS